MTAIQAATINVARTFHKDKDYAASSPEGRGSLDRRGRPLKDIWATQNVKLVVLNGKSWSMSSPAM